MAKKTTQFLCSECGNTFPRWHGQCSECKSWNTVNEVRLPEPAAAAKKSSRSTNYAGGGSGGAKKLSEIKAENTKKFLTKINEFDRVMGNGVTLYSVNLFSASPGAGKTTLMNAVASICSLMGPTQYSTSEEGLPVFKNRLINRFNFKHNNEQLFLTDETDCDLIIADAIANNIKYLFVDSVQNITSDEFTGAPGSVSQVKGCAQKLNMLAKQHNVTVFAICHVTKDDKIAGPKALEHIVDGIFHIDTTDSDLRIIRPSKNRNGSIDTVGLFRMTEKGMISLDDPSKIFISSLMEPTPGSAITCNREGNRNLMLEIQALTIEPEGDRVERACVGLSYSRLRSIIAIMRSRLNSKMNLDIHIGLVGGIRLPDTDTSSDLAIAASLLSSLEKFAIPRDACFMGEVSLAGEIRPVSGGVPRVQEAFRHGFKHVFVPKANYHSDMIKDIPKGARVIQLQTITDLKKELKKII
ncbi:MAG: DNA repair protein RadA [Planctomycetes bacterium]|nr:DNA repair protein RadA [Planctomycetota bacterium]